MRLWNGQICKYKRYTEWKHSSNVVGLTLQQHFKTLKRAALLASIHPVSNCFDDAFFRREPRHFRVTPFLCHCTCHLSIPSKTVGWGLSATSAMSSSLEGGGGHYQPMLIVIKKWQCGKPQTRPTFHTFSTCSPVFAHPNLRYPRPLLPVPQHAAVDLLEPLDYTHLYCEIHVIMGNAV